MSVNVTKLSAWPSRTPCTIFAVDYLGRRSFLGSARTGVKAISAIRKMATGSYVVQRNCDGRDVATVSFDD